MNIPLTEIRPGRYQPRRQFDPGQLQELATSIRTDGLLDPPIVWLNEQNVYELIGGELAVTVTDEAIEFHVQYANG